MDANMLISAVVTAVASGLVASLGSVVAVKVHIYWLERTMEDLKKSLGRAHERIDDLKRGTNK